MDRKAQITKLVTKGWVGPDLAILNEVIASDVLDHAALPGTPAGRDGYIATLQFFNGVLSNFKFEVEHMVADGDLVSTHLRTTATHTGDGLGVPASGKPIALEMMLLDRFAGDQVAEEWLVMDMASLMGQITG